MQGRRVQLQDMCQDNPPHLKPHVLPFGFSTFHAYYRIRLKFFRFSDYDICPSFTGEDVDAKLSARNSCRQS